ncbi:hypothetical protein NKR23_g2721 [Pleurostoma richardsiae]|uniref:Uncharacterized protein n=1 Tax=Pleurostoma richardsiae TaxID=41990 RepID=A0AA38VMY5_9PEZI|nr:hypothetical protein NKR23_g2721 [Pleurostoma richardsiae]
MELDSSDSSSIEFTSTDKLQPGEETEELEPESGDDLDNSESNCGIDLPDRGHTPDLYEKIIKIEDWMSHINDGLGPQNNDNESDVQPAGPSVCTTNCPCPLCHPQHDHGSARAVCPTCWEMPYCSAACMFADQGVHGIVCGSKRSAAYHSSRKFACPSRRILCLPKLVDSLSPLWRYIPADVVFSDYHAQLQGSVFAVRRTFRVTSGRGHLLEIVFFEEPWSIINPVVAALATQRRVPYQWRGYICIHGEEDITMLDWPALANFFFTYTG